MNKKLLLGIAILTILTIIPAIFDGQRRFRWGKDAEIIELKNKLDTFPKTIGDWECTSEIPLGKSSREMLDPITTINRIYYNSKRNLTTNVLLLLGPTGPTAAHTPDICFNSRDYRKVGTRRLLTLDPNANANSKSTSKCYLTKFVSLDVNSNGLKSIYAWTVDGTWHAMEKPRFYFAGSRYLFKIQMTAKFLDRDAMDADTVLDEFGLDVERLLRSLVF